MHVPNRPSLDSIRLLHCFDVLMAECSVTRAAARLNVSQAAMSHALGRLRRLFGDPLLIKRSGGMAPTGRGLELHTQVSGLLHGIDRLFEAPAPFTPARARMRFTVMVPEFLEHLVVPRLVARLEREAPAVQLDFRTPDAVHAFELLERGIVDLRLGFWPTAAGGLHYKMLTRERMVCIARNGHPSIRGRISAEGFLAARHVRIYRDRTSVSMNAVDQAAAQLGRKVQVAVRVQNSYGLAQVVSQSMLIGVATERLARHLATQLPLQVVPLPVPVPDLRTALYWHERTHKEEPHRWLRALVMDVVRSI
ncbi:MAG: LysR family transcriptional regulator [Burkholderiales bacterium]